MRVLGTGAALLTLLWGILPDTATYAVANCMPYALRFKDDNLPLAFGDQSAAATATLDIGFEPGAPFTPPGSDVAHQYSNSLASVSIAIPSFKTLIDQIVLPQLRLPNDDCGLKAFLRGHRISLSNGQLVVSDHFEFEYWQCAVFKSQIADGSIDTAVSLRLGSYVLPSVTISPAGPSGAPVPHITFGPDRKLMVGITTAYSNPTVHLLQTGIWTINQISSIFLGSAQNTLTNNLTDATKQQMEDITSKLGAKVNTAIDNISFGKSNSAGGDDTLTQFLNFGPIMNPSFSYIPAGTGAGSVNDFGPNDSVSINFTRKGGMASDKICYRESALFGERSVFIALEAALRKPLPTCDVMEALCR